MIAASTAAINASTGLLTGSVAGTINATLAGGGEAALGLQRLGQFHRLAGLFDERHDVAHAEDAAGDALGMEILQPVDLLAGAHELDRLAGDGAHGERSTTAAVAVDAGAPDTAPRNALPPFTCSDVPSSSTLSRG